jgi:hypothetical protein
MAPGSVLGEAVSPQKLETVALYSPRERLANQSSPVGILVYRELAVGSARHEKTLCREIPTEGL